MRLNLSGAVFCMSTKKKPTPSEPAISAPQAAPALPDATGAPAPRQVRCPTCNGPSVYGPQNPWRPFCSERCKLIDIGAWADESFRMPTEAPPDDAPHGDPRHQD